jgi:hypothetical protein
MTDFLHRIRMNKTIALLMSEITVTEVPVGTSQEEAENPAENKPE